MSDVEEIIEEVKVDDLNVVEAEIEDENPINENDANMRDVDTPSNLKLPLKIPPPFPQRLNRRRRCEIQKVLVYVQKSLGEYFIVGCFAQNVRTH